MTPEQSETAAANLILSDAQAHANSFGDPRDLEAQTIAIILAAFDLATENMTVKNKRVLLSGIYE